MAPGGQSQDAAPGRRGEPSPQEVRAQLHRILRSEDFSAAHAMATLLDYVVSRTLDGGTEDTKESVIAAEVLGRGEDFDAKTDNIVRVQAHRLRARLKRYYRGAGAGDTVLIEVPKGHYMPRFSYRSVRSAEAPRPAVAPGADASQEAVETAAVVAPTARKRMSFGPLAAAAGIAFLCGFAVHAVLTRPAPTAEAAPGGFAGLPDPLPALWQPFEGAAAAPTILTYPSRVYLETEQRDLLRYWGPEKGPTGAPVTPDTRMEQFVNRPLFHSAGPLRYNHNCTTAGELEAAMVVGRLFLSHGLRLEVKRSSLLSASELRERSLVFVGSTEGNETLKGLWSTPRVASVEGDVIRYRSLDSGDLEEYRGEYDPVTGGRSVAYGLISLMPGLTAGTKILVLGGPWEEGTLAAARFVTLPRRLSSLSAHFDGRLPEYFEAVVSTKVIRGHPVRIRLEAAREIGAPAAAPS